MLPLENPWRWARVMSILDKLRRGVVTGSAEETEKLAEELASIFPEDETLALKGELGAGKTTFVRGLARAWDITEPLTSPSYNLLAIHRGSRNLLHLDAYRLSGPDELETIGWDDVLGTPETVVAVEWASRIEAALPPNRIIVVLEHVAEHTRAITLGAPDGLAGRLEGLNEWRRPPTRCPTCGGDVEPAAAAAAPPFCSPRCRLVDLGRWMNEEYRIEP